MGKSDIVILATVRSSVLDTLPDQVKARLGNSTYIEIDLNTPQRDESERVITYLNENGLLGSYAELSEKEKLEFVEKRCGGQLRDIILSLYETGALHTQSRDEGVSSDGEREQRAQSLLRSVLDRKTDDLYHPLSVMRLYAEIVDKWGSDLSKPQKVAVKKAIDGAISSIAAFRHFDRFRNLNELKTRLATASRRLA
jgi:hypothetical protein